MLKILQNIELQQSNYSDDHLINVHLFMTSSKLAKLIRKQSYNETDTQNENEYLIKINPGLPNFDKVN